MLENGLKRRFLRKTKVFQIASKSHSAQEMRACKGPIFEIERQPVEQARTCDSVLLAAIETLNIALNHLNQLKFEGKYHFKSI